MFASAHGSVENTVFNNIRSILKIFIDSDGPDILDDEVDEAAYLNSLSDKEYYAYINNQKSKLKNNASSMVGYKSAMTDIKKFIYTKVLYSPMARTNSLAFSNKYIADIFKIWVLSV